VTYFGFLALFLGIPIAVLSLITIVDYRRGRWNPAALEAFAPWRVMLGLAVVAFVYTTPWDNYLVATNVWWYDIELVSGIVFGWVPIEEYTFFLVQPVMTSLFLLLLMRYMPLNPQKANQPKMRAYATGGVFVFWLVITGVLLMTFVSDAFKPFTYLGLELSWALIPVLVQLAFGADILWRHRWKVLTAITVTTLYLSYADALAIGSGTWTIDPAQSLQFYIGGVLPVEEFIFFLLTNTLVVFGMTLVLAEESQPRAEALEKYALLRPALRWIRQGRKQISTEHI
jgi:lycopene cyclase domain-containing protein